MTSLISNIEQNTQHFLRRRERLRRGRRNQREEHGQKEMVQRDDIWCIVNPIEEFKLRTLNTFGLVSNPNFFWDLVGNL